jgi:Spy/CpxP family protein refolding chaperone
MKFFILILTVLLSINSSTAQNFGKKERKRMNRIDQLERVKLIETLNLTEEQSIRFFARRNEHRKEIESIEKKIDDQLQELESLLNSSENKESSLKKLNEEILANREKIEAKRKQFIYSLNDILTTEQISKLLLFERRFREQIKDLILKRKNFPR